MKYRDEIDGLRAFAVIPVIFFLAGVDLFGGGYVGVDVFFVISGYLITTLIINDLQLQRFSLLNFYKRRAKRLLPALILVILVSLFGALLLLPPQDLKDYFESISAVLLFGSNVFFWTESGYFDTIAEMKPLLHTWSLAVEEQYYILFPIAMILLWKFGLRVLIGILVFSFFASLILAEWASIHHPDAAFFLLPTRGWEILAGAFCAFVPKEQVQLSSMISQLGSLLGLALILFAIFVFDHHTRVPGIYGLVPVLGAVLVILFCRQGTLVYNLLSVNWIVFLGLISYSAYLWHQPLIAFSRYFFAPTNYVSFGGLIVALTLFLSVLSWKYIEQPFRKRIALTNYGIAVLGVSLLLFSLGAWSISKSIDTKNDIFNYSEHWTGWGECRNQLDIDPQYSGCMEIGSDSMPSIVVIGDSHAGVLAQGLHKHYVEKEVGLSIFLSSGCFPTVSTKNEDSRFMQCQNKFIDKAIDRVAGMPETKTVILSGYGALELTGRRAHQSSKFDSRELSNRHDLLLDGMRRTLALLIESGKKIVLIQEFPEMLVPSRICWGQIKFSGKCELRVAKGEVLARLHLINSIYTDLASEFENVTLLDPMHAFCDSDYCYGSKGREIWYQSHDHITPKGSEVFVNYFSKQFDELITQ